jgi:hypothetical protein
MGRIPGKTPQFDRLIKLLTDAKIAWSVGEIKKSEQLLKIVGSIAISEASEIGPRDAWPDS